MDKTEIMVYFSICGDNFDVSTITEKLKLMPSEIGIKGIISPGKTRPCVDTFWDISTKKEESLDINNQLNQILPLLITKRDILITLKKESPVLNFLFEFVVYIEDGMVPAFYFEADALKFMSD